MARKQKVMLVEDDQDCREILATMIRFMGYDVVLPSGNVSNETADVIVVYLDFPQMRTIGTIRALRADQGITHIPIIVFLPWKDNEGALAALEAGADDVFDAPTKIETLRAGIAKYAPEISDQRKPAVANHAPTTEAVR